MMRYLSSSAGTGGSIKSVPEDFIVREIVPNGTTLAEDKAYSANELGIQEDRAGKFTTFVLQKRDWDTVQALIRMAKSVSHGRKSIGYYGVKDKRSISVQLASIFGAEPEQILATNIKDMKINCAWKTKDGIELGGNLGNAFKARVTGCARPENAESVIAELEGRIPNYFDRQRFGIRGNNPDIGMKIMKGDFEGAVIEMLTSTSMEKNEESIAARKRLAEERDFKAALEYFPKGLRNERGVIDYMSKYNNPANALRKLPRGVLLMFVHSVQSRIFNESLETRLKEGDFKSAAYSKANFYGFPDVSQVSSVGDFAMGSIVGYETKPEMVSEYDLASMERMGISASDFKIKGMPELSSKGNLRVLMSPVKELSCTPEEGSLILNFSIPPGSYATILLGEITKQQLN